MKNCSQILFPQTACQNCECIPSYSRLTFRLKVGQSLGLHRDGSVLKLSVFATEMRRRLWWYITELDVLVAEECGFPPSQIHRADARMPLNINDADISTTDTTPPVERSEFTELTWALIRVSSLP